jgi:uncharacterized MAPEG superfamily protein
MPEHLPGSMTKVPFVCLAIVMLLPYLLATYGGYYRKKTLGVMDNQNPRAQAARLDAYGARIYAAHQNSWEAAALFTAAALAAQLAGVSPGRTVLPCLMFVALRVVHPIAYLQGWASLRSTVSTAGLACCAWLLVCAAIAA